MFSLGHHHTLQQSNDKCTYKLHTQAPSLLKEADTESGGRYSHHDISTSEKGTFFYTCVSELQVLAKSSGSGATPATLARTMLEVYAQVKEAFSLNDHQHYQFNPRDVTDWIMGLQRYGGSNQIFESKDNTAVALYGDALVD